MELAIGTKIRYTSNAGTQDAVIRNIKVGPTAKPGFMNTWLTLDVPAQNGRKFSTTLNIPADDRSLKAFRVQVV